MTLAAVATEINKSTDTTNVLNVAQMHTRQAKEDGSVGDMPASYQQDINRITKADPTALYAAAVLRPSLALAQGHALSLLQGVDVAIHEFTISDAIPGFHEALRDLVYTLSDTAKASGMTSSTEFGTDHPKGKNVPATLRFVVRNGQKVKFIAMFAGDTIMVHDIGVVRNDESSFPEARALIEAFATKYTPVEKGYIHHVALNPDGSISSARIENSDNGVIVDAAYPFITTKNGGATQFIDDYLASPTAALNLYGKPGTGKSTLMRKTATRSQGRHVLLVDNPVFYSDVNAASALIQHIRGIASNGERPLVFLEEVDEVIQSKKNNFFLPQLLSLTSGVISMDIKVVTATNLSSADAILDALRRGGRSFGNVEFIKLSREQALACRAAFGKSEDLPAGNEFTLAEVLTDSVINIGTNKQGMGFHG